VYRWAGTLTAEFAPEFTGVFVQAEPSGSFVSFTYDDGRRGATGFTPTGAPGFVGGSPAPFAFRSGGEPISGLVDAATIRDVSTLFYFEYRLADDPLLTVDPRLFFAPTRVTFTATPEPSTFALAVVGGLALTAGAVRRRRQRVR
jgi:hypothetical protein